MDWWAKGEKSFRYQKPIGWEEMGTLWRRSNFTKPKWSLHYYSTRELDRVDWHTYFRIPKLPGQIYEKAHQTTPFQAQSHDTLGRQTTTDEVEDRWEEAAVPEEDHYEGLDQHHQESTAEWDVHGDERTELWMQANDWEGGTARHHVQHGQMNVNK